jgi:hypothetical protein
VIRLRVSRLDLEGGLAHSGASAILPVNNTREKKQLWTAVISTRRAFHLEVYPARRPGGISPKPAGVVAGLAKLGNNLRNLLLTVWPLLVLWE